MTKTILLNVFLAILLSFGCAPKGPKPKRPRPKPPTQQAPVPIEGDEESPERDASNAVIEEGKIDFESGYYDRAAASFREAVTIDAGNGAAYYWLALAKLRSGEYGEAEGLIEKAITLLSHRPEWAERLEELQREFHKINP